jgi:cobalt-zinc-cadmium efflux system outer membrane protein
VNSSPNVRIASANVDAARASLAAARGTNGVSALAGYAEAPQGAAEGQIASRIMSYGAQVTLGDVAAYAPAIAQADATLRAAEADATAAERMERITVTGLYYSALKARAVLRARTDALALAQRLLDAANKRVAAGDAPRLDVVRAQVGVSRAEADLALARAAEGSATGALASEVQRPARTFALTMPDAQIATAIPEVPVAVAQALAHRADAASADRAVAAAEAAVNAARGSAIPPVTVGAGYNTGVDSGFRVAGPTFSATMAIPLGGSAAANVHLQRAQLTIAQARRDAVRRAIELEVASAVRTAAASLDVERATAQALDAAQRELAATTLGYDNGASTSLDVASARSTYEQAVLDALAARFDRLQAQALLDLEVGS